MAINMTHIEPSYGGACGCDKCVALRERPSRVIGRHTNKYTAADELLAKLTRYSASDIDAGDGESPYGDYVRFEDVRQMLHESVDDALMNRDE